MRRTRPDRNPSCYRQRQLFTQRVKHRHRRLDHHRADLAVDCQAQGTPPHALCNLSPDFEIGRFRNSSTVRSGSVAEHASLSGSCSDPFPLASLTEPLMVPNAPRFASDACPAHSSSCSWRAKPRLGTATDPLTLHHGYHLPAPVRFQPAPPASSAASGRLYLIVRHDLLLTFTRGSS